MFRCYITSYFVRMYMNNFKFQQKKNNEVTTNEECN